MLNNSQGVPDPRPHRRRGSSASHSCLPKQARVPVKITSMKVFYFSEAKQGSPEMLRSRLVDSTELVYSGEVPEPADYDVLIAAFPPRDLLEASPNLKALIIPFAGPPQPTQKLLRDFPHVSVHNTPYNHVATAETALALLLASAKFITRGDRELRRGDWSLRYSEQPQLVLNGKTALILGYGRIGQHMAPVCNALGMEVIGLRRTLRPEDERDKNATVLEVSQLSTVLPKADVLLIALPETSETIGLINGEALNQLPDGAVLVNVGRGAVVDEGALYQALVSRKLAAAGLDVWYRYPRDEKRRTNTLPSQYPFHDLENVVLSPHKAGWLGREDDSRMVFLTQMLNAYAAGDELPHKVSLKLGY